jgi:peptide/nickel transport system substrate-binding protein
MKKVLKDESGKRIHPYVPELVNQLRKGEIDRREFLRTTTLLGVSATAAYAMAGKITGESLVAPAQAQTPKKGGTLRASQRVQRMDDPATYDWVPMSNQTRAILEYIVVTGNDNVTRPYLAESWEASDDLKTWTFNLNKGIKWSNGDAFGADDVVHNFTRWLDPATGSSNQGLFSAMTEEYDTGMKNDDGTAKMGKKMSTGAVEKVNDTTVRLHLNRAVLSIPENLFNYPTAIVHKAFDDMGADLSKNPIGTGPYSLGDFSVGERCQLKRRSEAYWGGEIYLDEILYLDHGDDPNAAINALESGQVDQVFEVPITQLQRAEGIKDVVVYDVVTAQTAVARMKVGIAPFDNLKLRQALVAATDHQKLLEVAYFGRGAPGEDHHVAPIHPEYFALPMVKQDYNRAKALLAEAGYGSGIQLTLDVNNSSAWEVSAAEAWKAQLGPAGIDLQVNVMPGAQYWDIWTTTPLGLTTWTHRPLGVMVLNLAYRTGVPWNESGFADAKFDALLDDASATLDINERRKKMEGIEKLLQEQAVFMQPLWRSVFTAAHKKVKNFGAHPTAYHLWHDLWLDA